MVFCVVTAILAVVALAAPRAEAMCCACRGGSCTAGFCLDNVAGTTACAPSAPPMPSGLDMVRPTSA
jgi:hypothetical protein